MTTAILETLLITTLCHSLNPIAHAESNNTEWQLTVTGLVQQPLNITLIDLFAMPQTTIYASLVCAGPPSFVVTEGNWTGVRLWLILQEARILNGTVKVAFHAKDGYTTDLTLETAQQADVLVAYEKDGVPLTETLRLVVPGQWGYKWISQIVHIELVDYNFMGLYESRGYPDNGIDTPYIGPPYAVAPNTPPSTTSSKSTDPNPSTPSTSVPSVNPNARDASSQSPLTPSNQPDQPTETDQEGFLPMRFFYALTGVTIIIIVVIFLRHKLTRTRLRSQSSSLKNASNSVE